ncbi:MAG: mechanosensitive ion channel family protein [Planctomycetota bacterium]|jgi:small conductance mechanosensitive channel
MDWEKLMENALTWLRDMASAHGPTLGWALVTLIVGWLIARIVRAALKRLMLRARLDATLAGFTSNLVYIALLAFVVISALGKLGVQTGSFIAIVGAAGLAIGFALQGSLSNFASAVMIILFRPFRAGDFVEAGGVTGTIVEIQIFSTILTTPDNKRIIVPNSAVTGGTIVNYSATGTRRVDLVFGIGYGEDLRQAKEILERILADHPLVLKDPAPVVAVHELADSSVNFVVRPWCNTPDYWTVHFDVTETVKREFDQAGIAIPFPQRDVHLHQVA